MPALAARRRRLCVEAPCAELAQRLGYALVRWVMYTATMGRRRWAQIAIASIVVACSAAPPSSTNDAGPLVQRDAGNPPITDASSGDGSFVCDPMPASGSFFELSSPD